jgi:hypothetical protein
MSVSNTPEALSFPFRYFLPIADALRVGAPKIGETDKK